MITLTGSLEGMGGQAIPVDSSCPTQRWKGTRRCQLHSGHREGEVALAHPPTEVNCPAAPWDLSHKHGRNSAKPRVLPGASFAWHREALERSEERPRICLDRRSDQQTDLSFFFCFFFVFFCFFVFLFYFPLSYAMVIRNIVIKQQV